MPNINLTCIECKNNFYFSERDQAFYAAKGFQQPKRCWHCRQKRSNNGSTNHSTPVFSPSDQLPVRNADVKTPPAPGRQRRYSDERDDD